MGDLIRNGAKTISLQTLFGRLNNKKQSENNKSPKRCLGDLIIKECPEEILIKLTIVLKISKSSWNTVNGLFSSFFSFKKTFVKSYVSTRTYNLKMLPVKKFSSQYLLCPCTDSEIVIHTYRDNKITSDTGEIQN